VRAPVKRAPRWLLTPLLLVAALCGCTPEPVLEPEPNPPTVSTDLPAVDCARSVRTGALPSWAQRDFRDDGSSFRHVEGLRGAVVGVVFGYPLTSPPRPTRQNKILWVAQEPQSGPLHIRAQLDGSGPVVEREVGFGGGQSIIDLPGPGCWRLTLIWGESMTDAVDLPYSPPSR
jgi:hypothetical protein